MAQFSLAHTRGWAANSHNTRIHLKLQRDRAHEEIALLGEQLRILSARTGRIAAQHRPRYTPAERMGILQIKAARGWSLRQTAKAFWVTPETISSWLRRIDEDGPEALVQLPRAVNKFPELVRYVVNQLKALCPSMGKQKIAQTLARAGLHLGTTTVGRILQQKPRPKPSAVRTEEHGKNPVVTASYPNHVWHVDLTVVPKGGGFWCPWLPLTAP